MIDFVFQILSESHICLSPDENQLVIFCKNSENYVFLIKNRYQIPDALKKISPHLASKVFLISNPKGLTTRPIPLSFHSCNFAKNNVN